MYTLLAGAAFAADDPGGWSKAKWGMTEPQLTETFGAASIVRVPLAGGGSWPGIDVDLLGTAFRAALALDKDGRLSAVTLSPRDNKAADEFLFQRLQDALFEKYGRPWKSTAGHNTKFQWSFPTTSITLTMFQDKSLDFCMISLSYDRRAADPL
jgi:hypothetical protein